ncbi:MAG: hypothetical protein E7Z93_00685 [Cyanobacteria bacterium SIG32]|nr:hypothetical protein [Cyanobacteria bacterium SIG32]
MDLNEEKKYLNKLEVDPKRQKKYLNKCLRVLKGKKSYKIKTFIDLAKAIKISIKTFRFYNLNNVPEIKEILQSNRHEKSVKNAKQKKEPNLPQKNVKPEENLPQKNVEEKRIRSYEEIKAKLFGYKAFKTKNYNKLTKSAQILIDRQIGILEWVLLMEKNIDNGGNNGSEDNTGI